MENFNQQMRRVLFASAHEPRAGKKPCDGLRKFIKVLQTHDLHLRHSDKSADFRDFEVSFKATAKEIGKHAQETSFDNGIIIIGTLINTTPLFGDRDVIYVAYFNSEKQSNSICFTAIPRGKKVTIAFGRENCNYYVRAYRKKGWRQADFEHRKIYDCKIDKGLVVYKLNKQPLPEINFDKVSLDEDQQMTAANEAWDGLRRSFVFYRGKLFLR